MTKRNGMKIIAAVLLICMMVCTFTACTTTLKGTYVTVDEVIEQSFTFMEDNKVEASAFGIDIEGDYIIEDGKITITYSILGMNYDWEETFEKDGSSIFIGGREFVKEK